MLGPGKLLRAVVMLCWIGSLGILAQTTLVTFLLLVFMLRVLDINRIMRMLIPFADLLLIFSWTMIIGSLFFLVRRLCGLENITFIIFLFLVVRLLLFLGLWLCHTFLLFCLLFLFFVIGRILSFRLFFLRLFCFL